MGRGPIPLRMSFPAGGMPFPRGARHYPGFPRAIPVRGAGCPRVTRPFAASFPSRRRASPLDLHVLGAPPAFVLSQDRTLRPGGSLPLRFKWKKRNDSQSCACFQVLWKNQARLCFPCVCPQYPALKVLRAARCAARGGTIRPSPRGVNGRGRGTRDGHKSGGPSLLEEGAALKDRPSVIPRRRRPSGRRSRAAEAARG